ncbi:MAG: plasmid mobilization relaxosome protein MobC [Parcubacteria group bacterium]
MAIINVRVSDEMVARFDGWAAERGGRSAALRRLIDRASRAGATAAPMPSRRAARPVKLTVRLSVADGRGLDAAATARGLTRNAWAAALVRRRLHARPTFSRPDELSLIDVQAELRRIGVNINQIARALNTAVMEGRVLDLELAYLDEVRAEIRAHMQALHEAFAGNLAYWEAEE